MRDVATLRSLVTPKTWIQLGIFLILCSAGSSIAAYHFGAPLLFCAALFAFFLLPLFGLQMIRRPIEMAVEAYDGNVTLGAQAVWSEDTSSDHPLYIVDLDMGGHGIWTLELAGGERPVPRDKIDLPAAVTVWLHPETKEPRLIKTELGVFYPAKFRIRPRT